MERCLEHYYNKFVSPPLAPIFRPSEEEFMDPIAYVAKIKVEAEDYGVVKIIPPESFRPPFVIEPSKFEFTPRVQHLNQIDALFRVRVIFINKLVNFWSLQGQQFRIPYIDNHYIDLYKLNYIVNECGGLFKANRDRKWAYISKTIGFKPTNGPQLKLIYTKWIYPYEISIKKSKDVEKVLKEEDDDVIILDDCQSSSGTNSKQNRFKNSSSQPSSRMMAGVKHRPMPTLDKSSLSIDMVFCKKCGSGGDEARLLICESCESSLHIYCLNPPLNTVPKGDWRCPNCVADAVKNVSFEFGFHDSSINFNLTTFSEWANDFKRDYFKKSPKEVPAEIVEAEFWQNVINFDKDIQVKYGADLISSKVGSGFPRKSDVFCGTESKERLYYANHPWNLNNLPVLRESVLSHIDTGISGMMVPWVYVGMCFSTFCWHVEDHWTYSINYNHWGERKIWYGIAGKDAEKFDRLMKEMVPELFQEQPDLLHHMTTSLNPRFLLDKGIRVTSVQQNAGEFVITFPRAYHTGYNEGLNFAEAVNFAPPDWLSMGRKCLSNYASVKRTCVFSHEELVMNMVQVADKMSIGMCFATLEELRHIISREKDYRTQLTSEGCNRSEFCKFEDIPDDDSRSCFICRTTLYISGLVCKHKPLMVCMNHTKELCSECKINECTLKFRFTMGEMLDLARKLASRTTAYELWQEKVAKNCLMDSKSHKTDVNILRELLETWKTKKFPHCNEIAYIMECLSQHEKIHSAIYKIIHPKIRLRDNTRCQKADDRYELKELEYLFNQLSLSNVSDLKLEKSLEEIFEKIKIWKIKATKTIEKSNSEYFGVLIVEEIQKIIKESEEFNLNLKLPELDLLNEEVARCEWLFKAYEILNWSQRCCTPPLTELKEEAAKLEIDTENRWDTQEPSTSKIRIKKVEDFEEEELSVNDVRRFELSYLEKIIFEASKWTENYELVKEAVSKLYQMLATAKMHEEKICEFLKNAEGVGFKCADDYWIHELKELDWLTAEFIDAFRNELNCARHIQQVYANGIEDLQRAYTLKFLENFEIQCRKSHFEKNGLLHNKIISGRDDLTNLVEGESLPLTLFTSKKYTDNWHQLKEFNTSELLSTHLNAIYEQQLSLLMALRLNNQTRSIKETCSCGMEKAPKQTNSDLFVEDTIFCFLCNANFHTSCAQWEPFLSRMPPGVFLCPRCLRGRRPIIEDVEAACESAPKNSLELQLLSNLLSRSVKAFGNLQKLVHGISKGSNMDAFTEEYKTSIKESLVMALSLEVMDVEAYQMTFNSEYFKLFPIPKDLIPIWRYIQSRMVDAVPLPIIFCPKFHKNGNSNSKLSAMTGPANGRKNYKRQSSDANSLNDTSVEDIKLNRSTESLEKSTPIRRSIGTGFASDVGGKRRKEIYHADRENCAAEKCIRPYSDQVHWIQCESLDCSKWYHMVCVGQTVKTAQQITTYICYRCSNSTPSTSETTSMTANMMEADEIEILN